MKNLNYILILIGILALSDCEDNEEKPTLDNENAIAPVLISPINLSTYILSSDEATTNFERFEWSPANYGTNIALTYVLQLDKAGDQFGAPIVLARTSDLINNMTVAELNLLLYNKGIPPNQATGMEFRVFSLSGNPKVDTLFSDVHSITLSPFLYELPNVIAPQDGSTFTLVKDTTGTVDFEEISWSVVDYYMESATRYTLEFDHPDNSFSDPVNLYAGTNTQFTPKVLALNTALLDHGYLVDEASDVEFRVSSTIDGSGLIQSDIFAYTITPYSAEAPPPEPLYLIGAATLVGWDNTAGLPINWDEERKVHSITTELTAGGMKILKNLGAWAPQWGDDGNGDGTGGVLIYRPDEPTTDPPEIPSPGVGTFRIDVDIPNLRYTITPV
jgi:starch-binding outer membrane protein SusE/F